MWLEEGRLLIRQRSPRSYDGVDIIVTAPADAKLVVQLMAANSTQPGPQIEVPLADISNDFRNLQLDDHESRLLVRRTPGDALLVHVPNPSMVFYPGEKLHMDVIPHRLPVAADTRVQITGALVDNQQRQLWSSEQEVRGSGETVPLEITLPDNEGVYDIVIDAEQSSAWPRALRSPLRWKRAVAERHVQLIVISRQQSPIKAARELSPVMEIDPANSRWWEKVKLPQLPPLGQLPQLPQLPRFSRGFASPLGNGMRETVHHPLGEISQLKPSAAAPDVSWEAYALNVGSAGKPYLLEVDYPSDVSQTLGLSIVETNAAGIGADWLGFGHRRQRRGRAGRAALDAASARLLAANQLAAAVDHQSPRGVASYLRQDTRAGRMGAIAPQRRSRHEPRLPFSASDGGLHGSPPAAGEFLRRRDPRQLERADAARLEDLSPGRHAAGRVSALRRLQRHRPGGGRRRQRHLSQPGP